MADNTTKKETLRERINRISKEKKRLFPLEISEFGQTVYVKTLLGSDLCSFRDKMRNTEFDADLLLVSLAIVDEQGERIWKEEIKVDKQGIVKVDYSQLVELTEIPYPAMAKLIAAVSRVNPIDDEAFALQLKNLDTE